MVARGRAKSWPGIVRRRAEPSAVFLVGWFRSGTTFAWNILRQDPANTCFCEPLHEGLPGMLTGDTNTMVDRTHTDVEEYWSEYRSLDAERLHRLWLPWFGRERFRLAADDEAPDLYEYLKFLVSVPDRRPVLKFVRANLRAQWLRAHFPSSWIVHITRAPRDVWTSAVGRGSHRLDTNVEPDPTWGAFPAYFSTIARDIGLSIPGHPYRQFYGLWLLGERHVAAVADDTWVYEQMVQDFPSWAAVHLIDPGLADSIPAVRVRGDARGAEFHSNEWYDEQEAEVDAFLVRRHELQGADVAEVHRAAGN